MKIIVKLANVPIRIDLLYKNYLPILSPYCVEEESYTEVSVNKDEISKAKKIYNEGAPEPYLEYAILNTKVSEALLQYNRAIFHGTAFLCKGKAWIFAAVSGTGKTTQYLLWKKLYGDEVQIINGDKPVLSFDGDDITVHPSPWNGKENMGQMITAPLGGIILLKQSSENKIYRMSPKEAAGYVFIQFHFRRNTKEDVEAVCRLETEMLNKIPVWRLENLGDDASAILCHDTLLEEMK